MIVREIIKQETEHPDLHLKIRQARKAAQMSIATCSEAAKVSRQYWSKLENNSIEAVSLDLIRRIESVLKIELI
jgi:transcriptional regulator with XRE-family HTH domain